jgi:hypothetical protein
VIGILILLTIFSNPFIYGTWVLRTLEICMLITICYSEVILGMAVKRKRTGGLAFIIGTFIFFIALVNDILYSMGIIHTVHLSIYGFLMFIFSQAVVLSMRFTNAFVTSD